MSNRFNIYVITTTKSISLILEFLKSISDSYNIGPVLKDFIRDEITNEYVELPRKIILLRTDLFYYIKDRKNLEWSKNGSFPIFQYKVEKKDYCFQKTSVMQLYYPLNKESKIDHNFILQKKMESLTSHGLLKREDWFIHKEFGVCEFSNNVCNYVRAMIKKIVDNPSDFRVSWCRNNHFNKIKKVFKD